MGWCCCLILIVLIAAVILSFPKPGMLTTGQSLGCYTCESRSGSDRKCEDGSYTASYQESCVPREGGQAFGIFPHYCSKIVGVDMTTNSYVTIRSCSQRYRNECKNPILVNGRAIDGCIYSCTGKYCNSSHRIKPGIGTGLLLILLPSIASFLILSKSKSL